MRTLFDITTAILAQYPGKIDGLAGAPGNIQRVDFTASATPTDKTNINAFIAAYDWNGPDPNPDPEGLNRALTDAVASGALPPSAVQVIRQIVSVYSPADEARRKAFWGAVKNSIGLNATQIGRLETFCAAKNIPVI